MLMYSSFTTDNLKTFLCSLVQRVLSELQILNGQSGGKTLNLNKKQVTISKNTKKWRVANQRVNKLMNIIRFIAENEYFGGQAISIIEMTM